MFNNNEIITITDKDIEYFNDNFQKIEDIDNLISDLEVEKANDVVNTFSFLSNIENQDSTIDSFRQQMLQISQASETISDSSNSPFSNIIGYCNDYKSIYGYYKRMCDAKAQLESFQNISITDIDSAIKLLTHVSNNPNLFYSWIYSYDIRPEKFCNALKIAHNFIARAKHENPDDLNDKKVNTINGVLETIRYNIINCDVQQDNLFVPFTLFGSYLLDPTNNQLFLEHFQNFTLKYCYLFDRNLLKKNRHTTTIRSLEPLIFENLNKYIVFHRASDIIINYEKIIHTFTDCMAVSLTKAIHAAHSINYKSFTGSTVAELNQYEINHLISSATKRIQNLSKENLFTFKTINFYLEDVHDELKDTLKAKFDEIKNSIIGPRSKVLFKQKNPDKYKQLVHLSELIYNLNINEKYQYDFDYYKDEILGYAENEGKESMPFRTNFEDILDNKEPVKYKIAEALNNFMSTFLIYLPDLPISDNQRDYIYQFSHGFLESFLNNWKTFLRNHIQGDNTIYIDCCIEYVFCLFDCLKLYHSTYKIDGETSYDKYKPNKSEEEADITEDYQSIEKNINNPNIPILKKNCYNDIRNILGTFNIEKIKERYHI